ncbi:MAG: gamma-glutamylcyclotransferase [Bryobacterales bacterium]|nr:gamma-glutamylcyclotransferase [Bryobacterales bacterium]
MSGELLFVYGTLRRGERAHRLLRVGGLLWIRPARIRGVLVHLGPYPRVRRGAGWVSGELICLRKPERVLPAIDAYESPEYRRTRVTVFCEAGHPCKAWMYFYTGPSRASLQPWVRAARSLP